MAAALAASLPTPQNAPAPQAPVHDAIPASMSKLIDIEADIPVQVVQLDAMVVSKIIQHSSTSHHSNIHGLLLGLDLDGILEVSNSFPLPHNTADEDDKSTKNLGRYQASMLRSLKEVRADDSLVGFYQATTMGAFFTQSLVDIQTVHQDKLRHGGIVVVHDVTQTKRGNASFRAFRLSKQFMVAQKRSGFSTQSLISNRLTFSTILEEVPIKIRTNPLLSAFLDNLTRPTPSAFPDAPSASAYTSSFPPSYSHLALGNATLSKNIENLLEALDAYKTEENNLAYHSRQIAREKTRAEQYIAKRKEENAQRVAQGLVPLPEEDIKRLFKIPPEPSRLESMLLLGQVDAYSKALESSSGTALVKMYGVKADAGTEL
ncbi:hypothetical protein K488DRAFT_79515 [Vararia minispora EC-137]|uniref:Uncharacterized protein n=1 Tax=Vararia minispora EC-137 TaxID=1314806 RepID=A0ACB8QG34_9AGAM|nr:hypothetical protein K488DRAFT_79515 [Vararia minispora EC-137]